MNELPLQTKPRPRMDPPHVREAARRLSHWLLGTTKNPERRDVRIVLNELESLSKRVYR